MAARSRKVAKPHQSQPGWCWSRNLLAAPSEDAARYLLHVASTPPLLHSCPKYPRTSSRCLGFTCTAFQGCRCAPHPGYYPCSPSGCGLRTPMACRRLARGERAIASHPGFGFLDENRTPNGVRGPGRTPAVRFMRSSNPILDSCASAEGRLARLMLAQSGQPSCAQDWHSTPPAE